MAGLEAVLRISAKDDTAAALAAIKEKILGIEKSAAQMDKFISSVSKVTRATDPLASSLLSTQKALAAQKSEIASVVAGLDRIVGPTDRAAAAQRNLSRQVEVATGALLRQGQAATRAGQAARNAAGPATRGSGHGGDPFHRESILPLAGPTILGASNRMVMAGATTEEEIARLRAAGATPEEIAKARSDFRVFSRSHSGVLESEYLGGFRDARVIAPGESHEMAGLGARYRAALRNSGISSSEYDVGNVLRIMDELGLKTGEQREGFLNSFLKSQQAFGGQITTETALAAYRNAKQSIYGWSPEFRDKYFPTLLQSAGQQGGTEMMTALNNYVGGHMSHAELKSLVAAGFVRPEDLMYNKTGDVKGLKSGAKLFEADKFKSNIAEWAWDFHDAFMKRKGATEDGFDDLIAKMPRNMAGLIAFLNHNRERFQRDAKTLDLPKGLAMDSDGNLAGNPVAGLHALGDAITQFSSAVTEPGMQSLGANLQATAAGLQKLAAAYGDFAQGHPDAAKALGIGVPAAGGAAGGYLTWKLFSGVGRLFGFGGGGAAGGMGAAEGGGLLAGSGPFAAIAAWAAGMTALIHYLGPEGPLKPYYHAPSSSDFPTVGDLERSRRSRLVAHPGGFVDDPEAAHGRALSRLIEGGHTGGPQEVSVHGDARVEVPVAVTVTASSELLRIIDDAKSAAKTVVAQMALNPMQGGHTGRMGGDAAPLARPATGYGPGGPR